MSKFYTSKKRFDFSITVWLILINVACFILFSLLIYFSPSLLDYIALNPSNIINKAYFWTFLTSMFMHANLFHLFVNMLSLMFSGNFIEKVIGRVRFILFYLFAGLFSGLFFVITSWLFNFDLNSYAVGASGALFGLVGLLMILTPNLPVYIMAIPIPIKMKFAAPVMLLSLWLISYLGEIPIGNTAHFGGLIAGIFYGFYLKKKYKNKINHINNLFS